MKKVLSSHLFANHRLTGVWLERIRAAGFDAVEIFCARQHLDYTDRAQVNELGHWFRDSSLQLWSLHAPMYTDTVWGRSGPQSVINIVETSKVRRIAMVDQIKRAIEIADQIPFRYLIQHIGVSGEEFSQEKLDAAFSSLEELKVFAGQRGVEILLENTPNDLSTARRLNYFLSSTHLNIGYCFDLGHAHMGQGIPQEFEIMKERIRSTHIHDNDGMSDSHFFPLRRKGNIDWPSSLKLLGSLPDQYPLLLELREDPDVDHPIAEAKRTIDELATLIYE
ncbi:MAG TPA: sugar phosphate isomerase/epimerase family protein [Bryobacteraceae bacterium]|jgi:sugar phosphate isomerase/epimerase|nr:sugar phosphate isomerase/epimerase family protein [Bryobacteraceae bacterium]